MSVDQLRLIPQNAATLQALTQQVLCWARRDGRPDTRVKIGTGWNSHVVIPPGLCQEYGAPTGFTSMGAAIACPVAGQGQRTYYILESDVTELNPTDCLPVESLATPTGLASSAQTATSVTMTWTASAGADGYRLEYRVQGTTAWSSTTAAASPGTISGLTAGTTYQVRIVATDSTGAARESEPSAPVTVTTALPQLAAPAGLAAGTTTATTIPLTWSAVTGAVGYVVRWRQQGTTTWTTRTQVTATADTITGLTASTDYEVQVQAVGNGTTNSSSEFGPTTPLAASTTA